MSETQILPKNILIPLGSILSVAPRKIEYHSKHYDLLIGIGKDHTARLIIDEDALRELAILEPEIGIF